MQSQLDQVALAAMAPWLAIEFLLGCGMFQGMLDRGTSAR
jgi:hypothetical protein